MEEEINKIEKKVEKQQRKIEQNSFALELLKDYKKTNKRQFITILVILCMWFLTIGYLVYLLNDIDYVDENTIDIEEVESIDNSHIKIGDDIWEKSN